MNKKFLTVVVGLFLLVGSASAQIFSMGLKVGYNVTLERGQMFKSAMSEMFNVGSNLQNGFNVGLYARIGRVVYVQPEVNYNYYTYSADMKNTDDIIVPKRYVSSTMDVPILLGVSVVNTNFFKLRIMAGPRFSFNAGSTKASSWKDFNESIRDTRVGLDCGLGVDIWRLNLDVRYNLFSDLYKRQTSDGTVLKTNPLNQFEVSLGFRLFGQNSSKR